MKAKAGVLAGLLCTSLGAQAQSSVTLFGVLDEGLNFTSNAGGHRAWQTASVDLATSRWGIKGSEDLGGGLHAIFDLESGFTMDDGKPYYGGRLFGYQSYAGLQSDRFGTLTFGRQFDSVTDVIGAMTANGSWGGYLFSHPVDNDNTDATWHAGNAVKFTSANYGGLSATALYGFGNQAGKFASNRVFSAGVNYVLGTLTMGAVYEDLSLPGTTAVGSIASDDANFSAGNQKIYGLGASYGVGAAVFGLVYTHVAIEKPASSLYVGDFDANTSKLNFDNVELNARYNLSDAVLVGAMYTYTRAHLGRSSTDASRHWNQVGVMGQYLLSKRTSLYAQAVYQKLSGGDGSTPLDTAYVLGAAGPSSNGHQVVARVGVSHSF
ncbi:MULTISPECIES: porin [unclassified Paraburkholderia]|uniref:porin n=1 Tax=unclassified Paraburkholderia TaxID=2615204 RepID=UPI002AB202DA|nr:MULTISPECIES: porin [unclassified Paraburkholderia]